MRSLCVLTGTLYLAVVAGMRQYRTRGSSNAELVEGLKDRGLITNERVLQALLRVDRKHYAPVDAYTDSPQTIGHGATISAPHMHAHALELLEPYLLPGNTALDIGCGSGYLTAAIAQLVNAEGLPTAPAATAAAGQCPTHTAGDDLVAGRPPPQGVVVGIDVVEELVDLSKKNVGADQPQLLALGDHFVLKVGDGWEGDRLGAPFNAIHVGAAAREMPQELVDQLASPGRMVIPIGPAGAVQTFVQLDKDAAGNVTKKRLFDVSYVPLV